MILGVTATVSVLVDPDVAYTAAFEHYWDDVFRFALAWTNEWSAAEDLTQEAYLRLWRERRGVSWDRPILPWLVVAVRRLATDRFRRLRRTLHTEVPAREPPPSVRDDWIDVRGSLRSLSSRERSALLLTAVQGWTYADAASVMGTSPSAVRSLVNRARGKLESGK